MHTVIVGAGPGGLYTALNLAGQGIRVTVVEKETIPGGRMRGLTLGENAEYALDTGPTMLEMPETLRRLFRRAGLSLDDYVELRAPSPVLTRVGLWDGSHFDLSADLAANQREIAKFGADKPAAFRRWVAEATAKLPLVYEKFIACRADSLAFFSPWRYRGFAPFKPWQTLDAHFDEHFGDDRLTWAFAYASKYLGLHPTTCPSLFSVFPFMEMAFGLWHPVGGFRAYARALSRAAEDLGVQFRMGKGVARIRVDEGRARGVVLANGDTISADAVIVNADLAHGATTLIEPRWRERSRISDRWLTRAKYSCSAFMAYLGIDRRYDHLPHHVIHISDAVRRSDRQAMDERTLEVDDPAFYVCNPTVTDPSGAPDGHSTLYVLVPTPNLGTSRDWKAVERTLASKLPSLLAKVGFTDVEKHVRAQRIFTAETWRSDFNVFRGAIFNLAATRNQIGPLRPPVRTKNIESLYWVGGGTHPGSGLMTILESANLAADYLLEDAGRGRLPGWPYVPPVPDLRARARQQPRSEGSLTVT